MPIAERVQEKLPDWIIPITNSRLIVSRTGAAFLVDCGNRQVIQEVERLQREGAIKRLLSLGYNRSANPEAGLADALRTFQADNQLPITGDLDAASQSKLSDVFGC